MGSITQIFTLRKWIHPPNIAITGALLLPRPAMPKPSTCRVKREALCDVITGEIWSMVDMYRYITYLIVFDGTLVVWRSYVHICWYTTLDTILVCNSTDLILEAPGKDASSVHLRASDKQGLDQFFLKWHQCYPHASNLVTSNMFFVIKKPPFSLPTAVFISLNGTTDLGVSSVIPWIQFYHG